MTDQPPRLAASCAAPALALALAAALVLPLAACGDPPDPCAGATETCVAVTVTSSSVERIDLLELDLLYGALHDTLTVQLDGATHLPVAVAIRLTEPLSGPEPLALVVAGKLAGGVLGMGAASPEVPPGGRAEVSIELGPPQPCTPNSFYCGGDKVPGDPGVLYLCNGGGVPFARGRCPGECVVNPSSNDACRGVGGPCVETGYYCGGNKLDGDPRSRYQCIGGVARNRLDCPNGCEIRPAGQDDDCR